MLFNAHTSFLISDRSYMSSAKRDIAKIAMGIGFTEQQKGRIDIIVSELTSNLIKHNAINGEILVKQIEENSEQGLEILSVDNGPGMHDPKRMMEDGVSTYGSKGEGLGAIKRLSDQFDIFSMTGMGTYILSRIYVKRDSPYPAIKIKKKGIIVQAVMVPKSGEIFCGDGWSKVESQDQFALMAADGLGHGKDAHLAAQEAISVFNGCLKCVPTDILKLIHSTIKKTRGIVGGLVNINLKEETLSYCGIGNIAGRIFYQDGSKSLISYNGTLGHNIPNNFNSHFFKWERSSILVLHSDGLKSRWDLAKYPGLDKHHPSLMAAVIYKDNTRTTDDALIIVVRNQTSSI